MVRFVSTPTATVNKDMVAKLETKSATITLIASEAKMNYVVKATHPSDYVVGMEISKYGQVRYRSDTRLVVFPIDPKEADFLFSNALNTDAFIRFVRTAQKEMHDNGATVDEFRLGLLATELSLSEARFGITGWR